MRNKILFLLYANILTTIFEDVAATSTADAANLKSKTNLISNAHSITGTTMAAAAAAANDHVSMTKEAANLRSQHLLGKKPMLKQSVSITSLLFPGSEPIEYKRNDSVTFTVNESESEPFIPMFVELVESRKTPIHVDYYELPVCPLPIKPPTTTTIKTQQRNTKRNNLGQRLMGHSIKPLGYNIQPINNKECTILCHVSMNSKELKLMRTLIQKQYRVHYTLDSLPILVRSKDLNHAIRGYPLGFEMSIDDASGGSGSGSSQSDNGSDNSSGYSSTPASDSSTHNGRNEIYLNNHLRFTIYYNEKTSSPNDKIHVTGFDVTPVSIQHSPPADGWVKGFQTDVTGELNMSNNNNMPSLSSCDAKTGPVQNVRDSLLALKTDAAGEDLHVVYSYEVVWEKSELEVSRYRDYL